MAEQGFELNIEGLQEAINKAEKSITKLATTTKTQTKKIVESFNDLSKNGLGSFVQKLNEATSALDKFGKGANTSGFKEVKNEVKSTVNEVVRLTNTLNDLKKADKLKIRIEDQKLNTKQQLNDIKELKNAEAERARELERQNKANIQANKGRERLAIKEVANETRALMNVEKQRERQLKEADMRDQVAHKKRTIRLKREIDEMNRLAKAYKAMPTNISTKNVGGLIGQSLNATSINQRITAIHNLKNALKDLDTTTEKGKRTQEQLTREIARQEKELKRLGVSYDSVKNKQNILTRYSRQLRNALLMVFSLSQIKNYITQLVKIRAEFEMQQRSLEVLLQSKDEANKLWSQTVQLAVKSPFTVKELVTYTKQLAAYRIESDKLFETNKMLADVSAGLGVDMQRLILAFGQVKAANYLRGTELRQFSEAGVNMLGELSKYYTELEGKAVSVGEVFERISKRRVDFEDVAEIFKRITSEGGLFYQMQEKQSETTLGQWRNLIDSLHLMFNEIGKANDGVIKDFIKALRDIITNWQTISDVALPILSALIARWAVLKLSMLSFGKVNFITTLVPSLKAVAVQIRGLKLGFQQATKHARIFATSMGKGVSLAGGWATIISTVILVVYGLVNAIKLARGEFGKLSDAISNLGVEAKKDLLESIDQYKKLASTITDVTKTYKEREKAMQSMNRIFADILPQEMLEVENIRAMGSAYKDATDALRLHYATAAEERKKALVDEKIEPKLQDEIPSLVENFTKVMTPIGKDGLIQNWMTAFGLDREGVTSVFGQVINDAKEGLVDIDKLKEELVTRLAKYYNTEDLPVASEIKNIFFNEDIEDLQEILEQRQELLNISVGTQFITKDQKEQFEASNEKRKAYEKEKEALDKLSAAYSTYYNLLQRGVTDEKTLNSAKKDVYGAYNELGIALPTEMAFTEIVKDALSIKEEVSRVGLQLAENFGDGLKEGAANNPYLKNFVEETIGKDIKEFKGNEWTKDIEKLYKEASEKFNVDLSFADKFLPTTDMSVSDLRAAFEAQIEKYQDAIKKFEMASGKSKDATEQEGAAERLQTTREEIERMKKELPTLIWLFNRLGGELKGEKGGGSAGKDWYLELAKGLESVHKDFLTLNKDLDKTRAKELALDKNTEVLKTSLKQLGLDESFYEGVDFSSETSVIEVLEKIKDLPKITAKSKVEVEKLLADIKGEVEVSVAVKDREAVERMFDDMFANYEMTMELESEGLNADWFGEMFGFTPTSLDDIRKNIQANLGKEFRNKPLLSDEDLIGEIENSNMDKGLKDKFVKLVEKIRDAEVKTLQDQMNTYIKNLKDGLSDRLKIWDEYYKKEKKIKDAAAVAMKDAKTEEEKANVNAMETAMLQGASKKRDDKLQKADWNELKGSETYMMLMNNIEVASERLLNSTLKKLKDFKEQWKDMPYSEMKKVAEDISKIELALTNLKRAGQVRREIKDTTFEYQFEKGSKEKDINQKGLKGINVSAVAEDVAKKEEQISSLEKQLDLYNQINSLIEQGNNAEAQKLATANKLNSVVDSQGNMTTLNTSEIEKQKTALEKQVANGQKIVSAENARNKAQAKAANNIQKALGYSNKLYNSAKGLAEALGAGDGVGAIFADMAMQMMNSVLNTIMLQVQLASTTVAAEGLGAAMNSAMGPIGWIVMALELVVMGLTAIFKAHDKGLEKQIESLQDGVSTLEKAYERLEKAIERANSTAEMKANYDQATKNLQQQADAYAQMAALEEQKKNSDKDKVKEYQDSQQEALDKQRELLEEQVESLGATYVYRDVAEDFVNAWADAFAETGNGLNGLETAWDDYFNNIMKNMIAQKGATKIMEKTLDSINKALEDDFEIDEAEYAEIQSNAEMAKKNLDAYLQRMREMYPEVFESSGGDTMSGLQRGIHELSEDTGGIIAALLESIRFGVFDRNTKLEQFLNSYNANLNTALSPILSQLQLIVANTDAINSLLERATGTHPSGGRAFKIIM